MATFFRLLLYYIILSIATGCVYLMTMGFSNWIDDGGIVFLTMMIIVGVSLSTVFYFLWLATILFLRLLRMMRELDGKLDSLLPPQPEDPSQEA